MPRTRTRLQIRDAARALADQVNGAFVTDDQANFWIDQAIAALWDKVAIADPDRYLKSSDISTTAGTKSYALPADFYKLRGVELVSGSSRYTVERYEFAERNVYQNADVWLIPNERTNVRYRIMGGGDDGSTSKIYFEPDPGTNTYTVWYVQAPQLLTSDPDTFDGAGGWEEYVIYDVAAKMAAKEQSDDTAAFCLVQRAEAEARVLAAAPDRDAGQAPRVQDTRTYSSLWD